MKPFDLMINDWYQWYAEGNYYPFRVKPSDFVNDYVPNFEPIPLTKEILEKNGFLQVEDGVQEYNFPEGIWQNDNLLCGLDYNERGMFYTFSCDPEEDGLINQIYGIFYIHQLQHALRLCGLSELADNFII